MTTTDGENKEKGIFIPEKILKLEDLNLTEKIIYSIYYFYTFNGDGSCHLTNETLATTLGITLVTFKKAKKRLKDKGYIKTNGGIKVEATGINFIPITGGKEIIPITEGINIIPITEGDKNYTTEGGKNYTSNRYKNYPHNNNNNNENNIKEKVKRKVEVMEETTTNKPNNTSSNEVGFNEWDIFNDFHSTDGVTEGVINNRGMNKATQQTNTNKPSSCKGVEETVTPKTKTVVESGDLPYTYKPSSCKGETNVTYSRSDYGDLPFCDDIYTSSETYSLPSPTATKTAPQGARNAASGTTTHTEDKKPAEGAKTPLFDLQTPFDRMDKIVERKKKEKTPSQFSAWLMFDFVGQFLFQTKCKVSRDNNRVKPYVEMINSNTGLNDKEKASIIERITV
ncbi:MAG: hypothetical protein II849_07665 [Bacteroidales bacterium]|nr:hypothetical protein [Bacteroidales bacterium]